jgi:hypothetical protein
MRDISCNVARALRQVMAITYATRREAIRVRFLPISGPLLFRITNCGCRLFQQKANLASHPYEAMTILEDQINQSSEIAKSTSPLRQFP